MTNLKRCSTAFAALMLSALPALADDDFRDGAFGATSIDNNTPDVEESQETGDGLFTDTSVEDGEGDMDGEMNGRGFISVTDTGGTTEVLRLPIGIAARLCGEENASGFARMEDRDTTVFCDFDDDLRSRIDFPGTDEEIEEEEMSEEEREAREQEREEEREAREQEREEREEMGGGQGGNGQQGGQGRGRGGDDEGEED